MDRMHHQLELIGETATLYVQGTLAYEDIGTLIALCDSMPDGVRTLRLDLHGLGQLSAEATDTVRLLLKHWREARRGDFRLTTAHLLATVHQVRQEPHAVPVTRSAFPHSEALQATYL